MLGARFEEVARFHPVEVVSPGFVLASAAAMGEQTTIVRYPVELLAPFVGVEVEVTGAGSGSVVAGLAGAEEPWLRAEVEPSSGAMALRLLAGGVDRTLASTTGALPATPWTLGVAVCENAVTLLVRAAGGQWEARLTGSVGPDAGLDLRDPSVLATLGVAWGVDDGAVRLGDARAGVFGMAGLRDPHLVQRPDSSPYTEDGDVFVTWTCAGFGFFPQAHWGVFRLSLEDPTAMTQVAHLFVERDGLVLGDHAGHLVRDGDAWLVANSTWGDFDGAGVGVRSARTTEDLLRGVHLLRTEPVALPTTVSAWDPALARADGRWHVAFVESPSQDPFVFHPALAVTDGPDPFTGLEPVAALADLTQTEGTLLVRDTDGWRVLASDGEARRYPVYDLGLAELGAIVAPYGTNIPHPQVVPRPDGGWLLVTFDGTSYVEDVVGYGAHGSVVVMRSVES